MANKQNYQHLCEPMASTSALGLSKTGSVNSQSCLREEFMDSICLCWVLDNWWITGEEQSLPSILYHQDPKNASKLKVTKAVTVQIKIKGSKDWD